MPYNIEELNAYFESKLAITLCIRANLLPIVQVVSDAILHILNNQTAEIIQLLSNKKVFNYLTSELYGEMFGALDNRKHQTMTPDTVVGDMLEALNTQKTNLAKIMPIHVIFGFAVLRLIHLEPYVAIKKSFNVNHIVQDKIRYITRRHPEEHVVPRSELGVCYHAELQALLETSSDYKTLKEELNQQTHHKVSYDRYQIIQRESFNRYLPKSAPLVAGPSTHTISLLTALKLYMQLLPEVFSNKMHEEALRQYALAYFSYLTTAGYHTFHEVMLPASVCLNLNYYLEDDVYKNYVNNMPASLGLIAEQPLSHKKPCNSANYTQTTAILNIHAVFKEYKNLLYLQQIA